MRVCDSCGVPNLTGVRNTPQRKALTQPQINALLAVRDHVKAHKNAPTYEEVGNALGMGKSAARVLVNTLRTKGLLSSAPGRFRNIVITPRGTYHAGVADRKRKAAPKAA